MLANLPVFCRSRADDSSEPSWAQQIQPHVKVHLKVRCPAVWLLCRQPGQRHCR